MREEMDTYWIYRTRVNYYRNQMVMAKLVSPETPVAGIRSPFQGEPYGVDLKPVYQVNPKWRHPDNYCDSFGFNLFSRRLVDVMREFGVKNETFLAEMVDNKTYKSLMRNYLMEEILKRGISGFEFLAQV